MAKWLRDSVTVTVKSGDSESTYTSNDVTISGNGDSYRPMLAIQLHNYSQKLTTDEGDLSCAKVEGYSMDDERKKLIANHASVITDVLKAAETTKLNSAIKRERMEQEIAAQERADRVTLMFAVNGAIQAGLSEEEVTASMPDSWASYVADMFGHVYAATDLDTVVNMK